MKRLILALLAAPSLALAACPPPPDIAAAQADLLAQLKTAKNELDARRYSDGLWELWATAPDDKAQAMLDRGMSARSSYDFERAQAAFDELVTYCPDYAEGYNQRAFVNFLRQDFSAALVDLDLALERAPLHVAAIAGKALTLMGLGQEDEAQLVLREALRLNPWLSERALLTIEMDEEL